MNPKGFPSRSEMTRGHVRQQEETMEVAAASHFGGGFTEERMQLVSFNLGKEEYGVEVLKVREIIRMSTITRVPNMPRYVEGVINLRGKVIPVISLRKKFDLGESENDNRTRIMVMEMAGELTGFIVDSVAEVIRISAGEIQPTPPLVTGNIDQECLSGVINQDERLLVLLNLERLFSREEQQLLSGSSEN
jgi:purine-binding chemotaxis protein CheW